MKKRYRGAALVCAGLLIVSGCGKQDAAQQNAEQTTEQVEVTQEDRLGEFQGSWKYDNVNCYLTIDDSDEWKVVDSNGNILGLGTAKMNGDLLSLYSKYNEDSYVVFDKEGDQIKDYDGQLLSRVDSAPQPVGYPLQEYFGTWEGTDQQGNGYIVSFQDKGDRIYLTQLKDGIANASMECGFVYENGKIKSVDTSAGQSEYTTEYSIFEDGTLHMVDTPELTFKKTLKTENHVFPTPFDTMSQSYSGQTAPELVYHYPETLAVAGSNDMDLQLVPAEKRAGHEDADSHSVLSLGAVPCTDSQKKYINMGEFVAKQYVQMYANLFLQNYLGDYLKGAKAYDFVNGDNYYEMQLLCSVDKNVAFNGESDVIGYISLRFVDGQYIVICSSFAPAENITSLIVMADSLLDAVEYPDSGWTTAGTEVPDTAAAFEAYQLLSAMNQPEQAAADQTQEQQQTQPQQGQSMNHNTPHVAAGLVNNAGASGRRGNEGIVEPFYWTDSDGFIWFWNGSENIGYGYEGDFYTEDGMLYESNDAGWDDDLSFDYDYDYDPYYDYYDMWYSDPGDYYDSDPGDTAWYYDEPNPYDSDAGGYSDPGDYYYDEPDPYDSDAGDYYEEPDPYDSDAGGYSDPGDYYDDYGDYGYDDY